MGQVVQVNGDYNIKTKESARITLDTGAGVGEVRVTGNLVVDGDTLTVSAENLQVQDNIITLNYGETGAGVSLIYSGIEVDRGTETNSAIIYNETDQSWNIVNGTVEAGYGYASSRLRVKEILTNADTDDGNLTLINDNAGVVNVGSSVNYEDRVLYDNDIPNRKFVLDAIQNQPARQIISDAEGPSPSRVIISDVDAGDLDFLGDPVLESEVAIIIDSSPVAKFYSDRTTIETFLIQNNELSINDSNTNLILTTTGSGIVETPKGFALGTISAEPVGQKLGYVIMYSNNPAAGSTGLYFLNNDRNEGQELISKNKALVFSMLF